tara:strand:+ start:2722 stop:3306 length:585 start_codon:yes stop_codon:yes gene_type:complete
MEVGRSMSSEDEATSGGLAEIFLKPSATLSKWYIAIGTWGFVLAILNMAGQIHPTYRVSWGGLLTFEALADAFGNKDDAPLFVLGDGVFIAACLGLLFLGLQSINTSVEGGLVAFARSLILNDTWPALVFSGGGFMRFTAAWCLLLGFAFYIGYSALYMAWIDLGVYSVSITLVAFGFALNAASRAPPGDETVM